MPYDKVIKRARHDLIEIAVIDKQRHIEIVVGASSSSAPPPPPPLPVDMPLYEMLMT